MDVGNGAVGDGLGVVSHSGTSFLVNPCGRLTYAFAYKKAPDRSQGLVLCKSE